MTSSKPTKVGSFHSQEKENTMNYNKLREWLSEKEHIQWEHWSKSLSKELEKLKEIIANKEIDNALHLIEDRLYRWSKNWKPYKELKDNIKEFDREWADKILDNIPFKCANCKAVYHFDGFKKKRDLSQKNKKEVRHSSHDQKIK